jgi:hypothetical protein
MVEVVDRWVESVVVPGLKVSAEPTLELIPDGCEGVYARRGRGCL